jgi:hypothetical protein
MTARPTTREELPPLRAPRAGPAGGGTLRNFAMAREPEPCSVYGNGLSAGVRTSRAHTLTAPELEFVVRDVNRGIVNRGAARISIHVPPGGTPVHESMGATPVFDERPAVSRKKSELKLAPCKSGATRALKVVIAGSNPPGVTTDREVAGASCVEAAALRYAARRIRSDSLLVKVRASEVRGVRKLCGGSVATTRSWRSSSPRSYLGSPCVLAAAALRYVVAAGLSRESPARRVQRDGWTRKRPGASVTCRSARGPSTEGIRRADATLLN